jgi:hypothetical protein
MQLDLRRNVRPVKLWRSHVAATATHARSQSYARSSLMDCFVIGRAFARRVGSQCAMPCSSAGANLIWEIIKLVGGNAFWNGLKGEAAPVTGRTFSTSRLPFSYRRHDDEKCGHAC